MDLRLNNRLGRAPPLEGKTFVALRAFLGIYPGGVEYQSVILFYLLIHRYRFLRALRDAQPALKTFLRIYLVSHFILQ